MLNINRKDTIETDNWIRVIFLLPPFNFGHNAFHNARIRRSYPILSGERVMVVGKFENIFENGEISIPRFMEISPIRIISLARLNRKITEISRNACPTYPAYRTTII